MRISMKVIARAEQIGASISTELDGKSGAIYVWFSRDGRHDVCELGVSTQTMLEMLHRMQCP